MRNNFNPGIPIFFKLWFAFVALCVISVFAFVIYVGASLISAGPEGVGRAVGSFVKGIDQGRQ